MDSDDKILDETAPDDSPESSEDQPAEAAADPVEAAGPDDQTTDEHEAPTAEADQPAAELESEEEEEPDQEAEPAAEVEDSSPPAAEEDTAEVDHTAAEAEESAEPVAEAEDSSPPAAEEDSVEEYDAEAEAEETAEPVAEAEDSSPPAAEEDAAEEEDTVAEAEETAEPVAEAEEVSAGDDDAGAVEELDAEQADEDESSTVISEDPTDEELFLAALGDEEDGGEAMFTPLKRGQIVSGMIASKDGDEIMVDVGAKSEGLIGKRDIEALDDEFLAELAVGDELDVYVITPEGPQGHPILSIKRARETQDWQKAEEFVESEEVYEGEVSGFNKGGLLMQFGRLRGFIPASQVAPSRRRQSKGSTPQERWGDMVGDEIAVKVIEVNRRQNRLILSERAAAREQREERRAELIEKLEVGEVIEGTVVRLTDFGAFVDIGGADGLVHLSELAWRHVKHPKDVLEVGEKIKVEVIKIDEQRQRIGLSRKNCLNDPWETIAEDYNPDELVQARITKLTNFGAFARLQDSPAIEGLVHISELAEHRVGHPREVVSEGDVVTLRIIRIEPERRRLGLSLKRVNSEDYIADDWESLYEAASGDEDEDE